MMLTINPTTAPTKPASNGIQVEVPPVITYSATPPTKAVAMAAIPETQALLILLSNRPYSLTCR